MKELVEKTCSIIGIEISHILDIRFFNQPIVKGPGWVETARCLFKNNDSEITLVSLRLVISKDPLILEYVDFLRSDLISHSVANNQNLRIIYCVNGNNGVEPKHQSHHLEAKYYQGSKWKDVTYDYITFKDCELNNFVKFFNHSNNIPVTKKAPIISIITTVLNDDKYIEQTIQSVLFQTFTNYEYIVIDADSIDNTKCIIEKYLPFITHYISETDNGIYDGMNKGINKASGEYFVTLNSGDFYFDENVLGSVAKLLSSEKSIDALHGDAYILKMNSESRYKKGSTSKILYLNQVIHPTFFVKTTLVRKLGYYNIKYKIAADLDFFIRFLKYKGHLEKLSKPIVFFREGGLSSYSPNKILEGFDIRKNFYNKNPKIVLVYLFYYLKKAYIQLKARL